MRLWLCLALAACGGSKTDPSQPKTQAPLREVTRSELRTVADFNVITDRAQRSRALFIEAARVFTHPRCVNCHPTGDVPHQGMEMVLHDPPVVRGEKDSGVPGMECTTCHQD